ncbi:MAG: hypothetical protein KTR31_12270 [Myxococcales bacterium]|nr:hypothetical protein [Myxococcales bacterium]
MRYWAGFAVLLASGCSGGGTFLDGVTVWDNFPFDGESRSWAYANTTHNDYKIVGETVGKPDVIDGQNVYAVRYWTDCVSGNNCTDNEELRRIRWRSNSTRGVFVHGYTEGSSVVEFDPPLQIAETSMLRNEVVTTVTGGATWTSTFMGVGACPVTFTTTWDSCTSFLVETDAAAGGGPITGTYWAVKGHNVVAFELDGEEGVWEGSNAPVCEGSCDGIW